MYVFKSQLIVPSIGPIKRKSPMDKTLHLEEAAAKLEHPDADLLGANRARLGHAQALMREFGARGVPTLIVESGAKRRLLDHAAAYSNPQALLSQLEAA